MPQYGEVVYNITDLRIARLNADNSFGTPVLVDYAQKMSWQYEGDEDIIKAYGLIVEKLSITTHGTGSFQQASLDFPAAVILTGDTSSSSGSAPNQIETMDVSVGGSGLPYFGFVMSVAATNGARFFTGAPKCMLDKPPGFNIDQNKFRIGEAGFTMLAPSTTARKLVRYRRIQGTGTFPTSSADFAAFFTGFF